MHHIDRPPLVPARNHARDINLARPLRDHLNIDIVIPQRRQKPPGNPNTALQLPADQADDRHLVLHFHGAVIGELLDAGGEVAVVLFDGGVLFGFRSADVGARGLAIAAAVAAKEGVLAVDGQGDVHFVEFEQVDLHVVLFEDEADLGEELGRADFAVGVHVDDCDGAFGGYGRGAFGAEEGVGVFGCGDFSLGDDGTGGGWVFDVFDADGDVWDAVVDGEMVDDFGAVEGELVHFAGVDGGEEFGGGYFARVSGEETIDLFPSAFVVSL